MLRVEGSGPDQGKKELGFNEICVLLRDPLPPPPSSQAQTTQQAAAKRRRRSGFKWATIAEHV
jgi:hypothetical protein